jgi:hypothetical protein
MEETCSFETSVGFIRTTLRYIPQDWTLHKLLISFCSSFVQKITKKKTVNKQVYITCLHFWVLDILLSNISQRALDLTESWSTLLLQLIQDIYIFKYLLPIYHLNTTTTTTATTNLNNNNNNNLSSAIVFYSWHNKSVHVGDPISRAVNSQQNNIGVHVSLLISRSAAGYAVILSRFVIYTAAPPALSNYRLRWTSCSLFDDAVTTWTTQQRITGKLMSDKLKRMWKYAVLA